MSPSWHPAGMPKATNRARIPSRGQETELACYPARETALVNGVVSAGYARYRIRVVERVISLYNPGGTAETFLEWNPSSLSG